MKKTTYELLSEFYKHFYGEKFQLALLSNTQFADVYYDLVKCYKENLVLEGDLENAIKCFIGGKNKYHRFLSDYFFTFDEGEKTIYLRDKKTHYAKFTLMPDHIDFYTFTYQKRCKNLAYVEVKGKLYHNCSDIKRSETFKIKKLNPLYKKSQMDKLYALGLDHVIRYLNGGLSLSQEYIEKLPNLKYSRLKCGTIFNASREGKPAFVLHMRGKYGKASEFEVFDLGDGPTVIHDYCCPADIPFMNTITGEDDRALFDRTDEQIRKYDEEDRKEKFRLFDPVYGTEAETNKTAKTPKTSEQTEEPKKRKRRTKTTEKAPETSSETEEKSETKEETETSSQDK